MQEAITAFISEAISVEDLSFEDLFEGQQLGYLLSMIQNSGFEYHEKNEDENWTGRLKTMKSIFQSLKQYYLNELEITIDNDAVDLASLCRNKDQKQLQNICEIIITACMQSSNRSFFIQKIISLKEEHQEMLSKIIKRRLYREEIMQQQNVGTQQKQILMQKLEELENSNNVLSEKIQYIAEQNNKLKERNEELEGQVRRLQQQSQDNSTNTLLTNEQAIKHMEQEHVNLLVSTLKEKLMTLTIENQKLNIKYEKSTEQLNKHNIYLKEIQGHMQDYQQRLLTSSIKTKEQEKEIKNLKDQVEEKNCVISKLQNEIKKLNNRIDQLDYQKFNIKLQTEKLNVRNHDFQNQIKKKLSVTLNDPYETPTRRSIAKNRLSELCPELEEDSFKKKCEYLEEQIAINSRRIKDLERDLSKTRIKAEKVQKLEKQILRLQDILVDLTTSKTEQIQLLTSALHQLRIRYKNLTMIQRYPDKEKVLSKTSRQNKQPLSIALNK